MHNVNMLKEMLRKRQATWSLDVRLYEVWNLDVRARSVELARSDDRDAELTSVIWSPGVWANESVWGVLRACLALGASSYFASNVTARSSALGGWRGRSALLIRSFCYVHDHHFVFGRFGQDVGFKL